MAFESIKQMNKCVTPVVLCGGSGTRLWPVSRKQFPKQFAAIVEGKSLLELTLNRLTGSQVFNQKAITFVTAEAYKFLLLDILKKNNILGRVILEKYAKNTAIAIALAINNCDPSEVIMICPSDHYIPENKKFSKMISDGYDLVIQEKKLVTFGIQPNYPATGYGYIKAGGKLESHGYHVNRFIEKPDLKGAQDLLKNDKVFWNSGIFLGQCSVFLEAFKKYATDIYSAAEEASRQSKVTEDNGITFIFPDPDHIKTTKKISVDKAIMEKSPNLALIPFYGNWSDIGTWPALGDIAVSDIDGNVIDGDDITMINTKKTFVYRSVGGRPVVCIGLQSLVVVDAGDVLLVMDKNDSENLRKVVEHLSEIGKSYTECHQRGYRPWGWYDVIDSGDRFQVKRICVLPNQSISLQKHVYRSEHWVVVSGEAEVTKNDKTLTLRQDESVYIPIGTVHRLSNKKSFNLEIIEVQTGSYLGEDDIIRLEDNYGRVS